MEVPKIPSIDNAAVKVHLIKQGRGANYNRFNLTKINLAVVF